MTITEFMEVESDLDIEAYINAITSIDITEFISAVRNRDNDVKHYKNAKKTWDTLAFIRSTMRP